MKKMKRLACRAARVAQTPEIGTAGTEGEVMTMRLINAYTIQPDEIKAGDVMLFTVKAMVIRPGIYRLYRCAFQGYASQEVPQGSRIVNEREVCEALFPTLARVAEPDPY